MHVDLFLFRRGGWILKDVLCYRCLDACNIYKQFSILFTCNDEQIPTNVDVSYECERTHAFTKSKRKHQTKKNRTRTNSNTKIKQTLKSIGKMSSVCYELALNWHSHTFACNLLFACGNGDYSLFDFVAFQWRATTTITTTMPNQIEVDLGLLFTMSFDMHCICSTLFTFCLFALRFQSFIHLQFGILPGIPDADCDHINAKAPIDQMLLLSYR